MSFLSQYRYWLVLTVIAIIIGIFSGVSAVIVLLSLILTYYLVRSKLSPRIFTNSYLLLLTVVFYAAFLQTTILFEWLIDHNFPLDYSVELAAGLLIIGLAWEYKFKRERLVSNKLVSWHYQDIAALAVAIIIVLLTSGGPIARQIKDHGGINLPALAVSYMDTNLDDGSHLSRINDNLQLNRGVLYKSNQTKYVVLQDSISTYPPGWHSTNASLIKAFDPTIKVGSQSLNAFVLTSFIWLFVLVFVFTRAVFDVIEAVLKPRGRGRIVAMSIWAIGASLFFSYLFNIEQFKEGFYPYIPLLISLLILIPLGIQLHYNKQLEKWKYRSFLPIFLMVANLTLSWVLIVPAVTIAILLAIFLPDEKTRIKQRVLDFSSELFYVVPLTVVTTLSILAQGIIILAPTSQTFETGVNTPGGIAIETPAFFGFIFIGVVLLLIAAKRRLARSLDNVIIMVVCLLAFSLFIFVFQYATIHQLEYYFYKTLYTAVIVALPLAIVGWLLLLDLASRQLSSINLGIIAIGLLISLPLVIGFQAPNDPSLANYILGKRDINYDEAKFIYNSLATRSKIPLTKRDDDVFMYSPDDMGHNQVATNILGSFEHQNNCDALIMSNITNSNLAGIFSSIQNDCKGEAITMVTRPQYLEQLKNIADTYKLDSNFKLKAIE